MIVAVRGKETHRSFHISHNMVEVRWGGGGWAEGGVCPMTCTCLRYPRNYLTPGIGHEIKATAIIN